MRFVESGDLARHVSLQSFTRTTQRLFKGLFIFGHWTFYSLEEGPSATPRLRDSATVNKNSLAVVEREGVVVVHAVCVADRPFWLCTNHLKQTTTSKQSNIGCKI